MNARIITSAVVALCLIFASCRSTRNAPTYPDGRTYPRDYPNPDGRYPDGRGYPTSRYPGGNLPPGHAKKVYGHKSAKVFAPGQQKKYGQQTKIKSKKRKRY